MYTKCTVLFSLALAKTIGCGSLQWPDVEGMEPEPVLSNTTLLFLAPPLFKTPERVFVGFQIFAWDPK
jgi:hypothetical protein